MGCRNRKRTVLRRYNNISIGYRRRGTGVTIDHLIARLHGTVRTYQHLQFFGHLTSTEFTHILCINGIGQAELFTYSNLRWSRGCQGLAPRGKRQETRGKRYADKRYHSQRKRQSLTSYLSPLTSIFYLLHFSTSHFFLLHYQFFRILRR